MVVGLYQRWGLGVVSGRPSSFWTSITLRAALGDAVSMVFMKVSYPTPFWTTSWAALTSWATLGLASKVWGSVLGLLMIAETDTYFPPIWLMTLAYSFSAPTAIDLAGSEPDAGPQAAPIAARAAIAARRLRAVVRVRPPRFPGVWSSSSPWPWYPYR